MTWLSLKAKLWAIGAFGLAIFAAIFRIRYLTSQRDKAVAQAESAKAQAHVERVVRETDAEIYREHSDLAREAKEAIKRGEVPDNLERPNDW